MADQGRFIGNLCSWHIKVNVLLTSAAVLWYPKATSNWGHPHDTYLLLNDTFLKTANQWQCVCHLCSWFMLRPKVTSNGGHPKNTYLPQHDIPFWKWQTKGNALVTSAADFGDLQSDLQWRPSEFRIFTPTFLKMTDQGHHYTMGLFPSANLM